MVPHIDLIRSFLQHDNFLNSDSKAKKSASLWTCNIRKIWKAENDRVFKGEISRPQKIIEKIKTKIWSWLITKNVIDSGDEYINWT